MQGFFGRNTTRKDWGVEISSENRKLELASS